MGDNNLILILLIHVRMKKHLKQKNNDCLLLNY
jgi:hypothetical protein